MENNRHQKEKYNHNPLIREDSNFLPLQYWVRFELHEVQMGFREGLYLIVQGRNDRMLDQFYVIIWNSSISISHLLYFAQIKNVEKPQKDVELKITEKQTSMAKKTVDVSIVVPNDSNVVVKNYAQNTTNEVMQNQ